MSQLDLALTVVGLLVLSLGMLSRVINRSVLTLPLLAFAAGVVLGSAGLGMLRPAEWGDPHKILEEAARLTLGISLMGIALRLPRRYPFTHWKTFAVLLGLVLPLMFLISSLLAHSTLGIPLLIAMLVGASICATDPVVASSIVTSGMARESLPERFRHGLSTESGANDGLAYPFVLLPVLLLGNSANSAWTEWLLKVVLWEVGGAILFGIVVGWAVGKALSWAEEKQTIDQPSFLATTLALTVLTLGLGKLMGTDSILAVFAAGIAFDQQVGGTERAEESNIQESVNLFFTLPVFALFGLMLPVEGWKQLGWSGVLFVVSVLVLRRLPALLLLRPALPLWRDYKMVLLAGHFGPIGVSALFYSLLVMSRSGHEIAWTAGSLIVCASLMVHGMSATPVARFYGRRYPERQ